METGLSTNAGTLLDGANSWKILNMDDLGASSSFTSVSPRVQAVGIKGGRTMG